MHDQAFAVIVLLWAILLWFTTLSPLKDLPLSLLAIGTAGICSATVFVVSFILIWIHVAIFDPIWAIGSLIFPPLVYRYLIGDIAVLKRVAIWHVISAICGALVLLVILTSSFDTRAFGDWFDFRQSGSLPSRDSFFEKLPIPDDPLFE